ncbi:MAG: hypothetical protein ACD_70C00069G0001 [uncultured bacterium]|nr:MAG: hypothetical protein ACD_70C00069G0001 [uncultured bacterium]OGT25091.1 MAG: hypothetical protein A3B71_00575 [Gammaproteobacteria bacterium RIFCSPHIGHO2_02_FULL_42_43]OGT28329.1 MAG: hypothetical protein A2624_05605 [Gammaproteobacteria bacterium RIFCSPHIGHO2_01_FULL_42_8]OGT53661.1 MAG: hypothetical protein A3E54_00280 [Gammaproteobacteria bacterium RIFCSPHIGHO2_12_FULL_41_25]OGT62726.1 MAG: hypothetical protein A3I77_05540 [Gammaproteobacteria bacterium RIFCSPLOWO2_02_FULL_42_14]OGT
MQRGDVVVCVLTGDCGKPRPAVVVQSDLFNKTHETITLCPVTTHLCETPLFRILITANKQNGLKKTSQVMIDKITTQKRSKIHQKIGVLTKEQMKHIDDALILWLSPNPIAKLFPRD